MVYYIALLTAGITAFYMFRLYYNIFWSKEAKTAHHDDDHHGEGTWSMKIPLLILSVGAIAAGFIPFGNFVSSDGQTLHIPFEISAAILPVIIAVSGIALATLFYKTENDRPDKLSASFQGIYKTAYHKFYIDEIYLFITKKIVFNLIAQPSAWVDKNIIDGSMNGLASLVVWKSNMIKSIQSGKVQDYALYFFLAAFGITALTIYLVN